MRNKQKMKDMGGVDSNTKIHGYRKEQYKALLLISILAVVVASAYGLGFQARPLLKFCYNSMDRFVLGQCVMCDFYKFSATVLACNGRTSALMNNITSSEAVCIISNCLQQVRQPQPQFLGRKKRETDAFPLSVDDDLDDESNDTQNSLNSTLYNAYAIKLIKLSEDLDMDQGNVSEEDLQAMEAWVVETIEVNVQEVDDYDAYESPDQETETF